MVVDKKRVKVIRPETDEVVVIRSDEELHRLFEELIKENDLIHRKRTPS